MALKIIVLSKSEEGMVLARALTNDKGITLCAEGTVLTQSLIARFDRMGIETLYIETQEKLPEEEYLSLKAEIERLFEKATGDPIMEPLKEIVLARLEAKR